MTKKVEDLNFGDHIDGESSAVNAAFVPSNRGNVVVLMQGGNWREYPYGREVELKPRTVAAKDAEGLTVKLLPTSVSAFKVEMVGLRGGFAILGGHFADSKRDHWASKLADEQLEVVDNA